MMSKKNDIDFHADEIIFDTLNELCGDIVCYMISKDNKTFNNRLSSFGCLIYNFDIGSELRKNIFFYVMCLEGHTKINLLKYDLFDLNPLYDLIKTSDVFDNVLPDILYINLEYFNSSEIKTFLDILKLKGYKTLFSESNIFIFKKMEIEKNLFVISSFGGCGTTFLIDFVSKFHPVNNTFDRDRLKHRRNPPKLSFIKKAVYLFGDPSDSILSFFRKKNLVSFNWTQNHCRNVEGDTCELNPYWDLEEYLDNGADIFRLDEHFNNWLNANNIDYPVMFVKYENMWEHLDEIFDFLEIPRSEINNFPKKIKRNSDWKTLSFENRDKIHKIYGDLSKKIELFPDLKIIKNKTLKNPI